MASQMLTLLNRHSPLEGHAWHKPGPHVGASFESELVRWTFLIVSHMAAEFTWEDLKISRMQACSSPMVQRSAHFSGPGLQT